MKRTDGVTEGIEMTLEKVPGIQYAFIYGSFAENPEDHERAVDIMVLGGPELVEMHEVISKAEGKMGRPFLITSFTIRELRERIKLKDETILTALKGAKTMLIGDEKEMEAALGAQG